MACCSCVVCTFSSGHDALIVLPREESLIGLLMLLHKFVASSCCVAFALSSGHAALIVLPRDEDIYRAVGVASQSWFPAVFCRSAPLALVLMCS